MSEQTIKLTGIVSEIFPVETRPTFSKKVFWLTEPDVLRYPNTWEIELHGTNTGRLAGIKVGDRLEVEVEVHGRKWQNTGKAKVFMSLKCVGLKVIDQIETTYKSTPREKPGREGGQSTLL